MTFHKDGICIVFLLIYLYPPIWEKSTDLTINILFKHTEQDKKITQITLQPPETYSGPCR